MDKTGRSMAVHSPRPGPLEEVQPGPSHCIPDHCTLHFRGLGESLGSSMAIADWFATLPFPPINRDQGHLVHQAATSLGSSVQEGHAHVCIRAHLCMVCACVTACVWPCTHVVCVGVCSIHKMYEHKLWFVCTCCVCVMSTHVFWSFEGQETRTHVGMGSESIRWVAGEALPGLGDTWPIDVSQAHVLQRREPSPQAGERSGLGQGGEEGWDRGPEAAWWEC